MTTDTAAVTVNYLVSDCASCGSKSVEDVASATLYRSWAAEDLASVLFGEWACCPQVRLANPAEISPW